MAADVTQPKPGSGATLLLVDDEPSVLTALRRTLARAGYNVLVTSDPTKALGIMSATPVDILIADLSMPQMSGAELVAAARDQHPGVVRIVLTGCSAIGEIHRFLTKPFKPDELRRVVAQAVARKEELHRSTEASRALARHERLMEDLEREHPGITRIDRNHDGVYDLDRARLAALESQLERTALRGLGRLVPTHR